MILNLHSFYLAGRGKKAELMQISVYFHRGLLAEALLNYWVYAPELLHRLPYRETLGSARVNHSYNEQGALCTPWFLLINFHTPVDSSPTHTVMNSSVTAEQEQLLCAVLRFWDDSEHQFPPLCLPCLQSHYKFHRTGSQIKENIMWQDSVR